MPSGVEKLSFDVEELSSLAVIEKNKPYQVKVRATLTTFKTLLTPEFIETADKIINVTVEGLRITTADVSVPENDLLVIGKSNKTIGVGVGADLNIGRSFIV
jgi:hypothetical protein